MRVNYIENTDCLIGMREIPDESVDCVVTDCPYLLVGVDGENDYPTWRTDKGVKIKKVFREKIRPVTPQIPDGYRIRKLTERECFRLMDMPEEYIDRIQAAGISRSQQYKMAGNSIVVDVMVRIFDQLLFGNKNKNQQLEIF